MGVTAMSVVDAAGRRVAENRPWDALWSGEVDDPWNNPGFARALDEVVSRRSPEESCEIARQTPEGQRQFVARMLAIPGGEHTMVTLADVTAFRARERTLQAEEERIRRLWERLVVATRSSQVGVWEWVVGAPLVHVDETMCALFELEPRPVVTNAEIVERIFPDDLVGMTAYMAEAVVSQEDVDWTYRIQLRGGGIRWVHVSAALRREGDAIRMIGTTTDITRRRVEEEQLRTLSLVAERTTDAVLLVRAGIVEWTNIAAERLLAPRIGELCGRGLDPALAVSREEREIRIRGKGSRWVSVDAQPLHPDRPDGPMVVFARDLTQRRQLEAERRMSHKLDAVGRLAAGLAHEINTPVQYAGDTLTFVTEAWDGLTGLLQHLVASADRGPVQRDQIVAAAERHDLDYLVERMPAALGRLGEAMTRIGEVVGTMREFGDPDRARVVEADLGQALAVALAVARPEVDPVARVELQVAPTPAVACNLAQVHDLLHALILNAAEAIAARPDGGRGRVRIWTRTAGELVEVGVEDDGCGMAPDVLAQVFDPFFSTKPEGAHGRGLGLTTARLVVVRHGGSIEVSSELGVGTRVVVRLPPVTDEREVA